MASPAPAAFFLVLEIGFLFELAFGQQVHQLWFAQAAAQLRGHLIVFLNIQQECGESPPSSDFPFLPFTVCSSVARFISSRANSRSSRM
jgi:hypothetical protein